MATLTLQEFNAKFNAGKDTLYGYSEHIDRIKSACPKATIFTESMGQRDAEKALWTNHKANPLVGDAIYHNVRMFKSYLADVLKNGGTIHFVLNGVNNLKEGYNIDLGRGHTQYAEKVTNRELRFVARYYEFFKDHAQFYQYDATKGTLETVSPPWENKQHPFYNSWSDYVKNKSIDHKPEKKERFERYVHPAHASDAEVSIKIEDERTKPSVEKLTTGVQLLNIGSTLFHNERKELTTINTATLDSSAPAPGSATGGPKGL